MGNGRDAAWLKRLKASSIKQVSQDLKQKLSQLVVKAKQHGYRIKENTVTTAEQADALSRYTDGLKSFQQAMEESSSAISGAGGTIELYRFADPNVNGDASQDGEIRMSADNILRLRTTLPHEHTHQLVNYLITKEMGYARGTPEYQAAYRNAVIYQSVNNAALTAWKNAEIASLQHQIALAKSQGSSFMGKTVRLEQIKAVTTPYEAAQFTGMRDYATRDYTWAPKGAGIEIPTVASENLVRAGYNWQKLKEDSPYSYYVLQELKRRLK